MILTNPMYTANMTEQQRAWFYAEYERARKDEVVGVLLALFLGCFGIHHFYLRRNGLGILYVLFSWTGITAILGFIECFLMPGRVRNFNAGQASSIASYILSTPTAGTGRCPSCGMPTEPDAVFCSNCGVAMATRVPFQAQANA